MSHDFAVAYSFPLVILMRIDLSRFRPGGHLLTYSLSLTLLNYLPEICSDSVLERFATATFHNSLDSKTATVPLGLNHIGLNCPLVWRAKHVKNTSEICTYFMSKILYTYILHAQNISYLYT